MNAKITDVTSRTARWGRGSVLSERNGQSALFGAVQWAWPRVVQYLIDYGADVAITDGRRVSPLAAALGRAGSADNHPSPAVAKGITNRPDELIHLIIDARERQIG